MKYPIGIQSFETLRRDGYVYVDKTDLVYKLALGSIYFLARPRRFGKSLLMSTLKCYFEGRRDLFEGLKIMDLEQQWTKYPVFHIDFNGKRYHQGGMLHQTLEACVAKWEKLDSDLMTTLRLTPAPRISSEHRSPARREPLRSGKSSQK